MTEWDRTHDWVVVRSHRREVALVVRLSSPPSVEELKLARRLLPEFSNEPPTQFRARIRDGRLELGVFLGTEARTIEQRAIALRLNIERVVTPETVYLFEDRTTSSVLLVEDGREGEKLAAEMIAAGIPVRQQEED